MNQKRWEKIEDILDKALALKDPQEINAMIAKACREDLKLYHQVTQLLESIKEAKENHFLEP